MSLLASLSRPVSKALRFLAAVYIAHLTLTVGRFLLPRINSVPDFSSVSSASVPKATPLENAVDVESAAIPVAKLVAKSIGKSADQPPSPLLWRLLPLLRIWLTVS